MKKHPESAEREQPPPINQLVSSRQPKLFLSRDETIDVDYSLFIDVIRLETTKFHERGFLFTEDELLGFLNPKKFEELEYQICKRIAKIDPRQNYDVGKLHITIYVCRESTEGKRLSVRKNLLNIVQSIFQILDGQCFLKFFDITYIDDDFHQVIIRQNR